MTKKTLLLILILMLLPSMMTSVFAQETFEFDSGYEITIPDDWEFIQESEVGYSLVNLENGVAAAILDPEPFFDSRFNASNVTELLENEYNLFFDTQPAFDPDNVEELVINGRNFAVYEFVDTQEERAHLLVTLEFSDGNLTAVPAFTLAEEFALRDELIDILGTFDVTGSSDSGSRFVDSDKDETRSDGVVTYSLYPVEEVNSKDDKDAVYGPTVSIPAGWDIAIEGAALEVSNDLGSDLVLNYDVGFSFRIENPDDSDQFVDLFDPLLLAQTFEIEQPPADLASVFEQIGERVGVDIDADDLEEAEIDGRDALILSSFVVLEMSTGEVALALFNEDWEIDETAMDILASFDSATAACAVGAGQNVNVRQSNSTSTGVLTTLDAQSLNLVDGQSFGSDGFVWWRLLDGGWVRVSEFYNCDSVPEVEGGTITEPQSQPAEPQTASGSGNDSAAPTAVPQQQQQPAQPSGGGGGAIVQSGNWTIFLAEKAPFSCAGTITIELPITDIFTSSSFPIVVTSSGGQIIFDGSLMSTADGNTYTGSLDFGPGDNIQFTATVPSFTQINGSFVVNVVTSDGTPCSATIGFTARAN